jgi:hypothetical protein
MAKKSKVKKRGTVEKIIKPAHPSIPEKAQISLEGGDELYKEIRIENALEDEKGKKVKLKEKASVEVVIEADPSSTVPDSKLPGPAQDKED